MAELRSVSWEKKKSRTLSSCHNGTHRGAGGSVFVLIVALGHVTALGSCSSLSTHANTCGDALTKVNTRLLEGLAGASAFEKALSSYRFKQME